MKIPLTGGCVCGAIRYECTAEPIMTFKCHCRDCQKVTGGAFAPGFLVPASAFHLTKGQLRYHFTLSAKGGKHRRGFCVECSSRITGGESDREPSKFVGILAGSLDDPSWFKPELDFFCIGRAAVGPNGPGNSEVPASSAASRERVKHAPTF